MNASRENFLEKSEKCGFEPLEIYLGVACLFKSKSRSTLFWMASVVSPSINFQLFLRRSQYWSSYGWGREEHVHVIHCWKFQKAFCELGLSENRLSWSCKNVDIPYSSETLLNWNIVIPTIMSITCTYFMRKGWLSKAVRGILGPQVIFSVISEYYISNKPFRDISKFKPQCSVSNTHSWRPKWIF